MAEAFLAASAIAIGWLLTYLLHSSALIASVWLVTRFMELQGATRDFLWKVALVGGLGTATAAVIGAPGTGNVLVVRQEAAHITVLASDSPGRLAEEAAWRNGGIGSTMRIEASVVEPSAECQTLVRQGLQGDARRSDRIREVCAPPRSAFTWFEGAFALWLTGGLLGLGVLTWRHRALRELSASLGDASPRARELLRKLLPAAGGLSVALHRSEILDAPCVLPGGAIALPGRCDRELTDAELRAVLAHELAHLARRDVMWSTLMRAIVAVFWVQPLNQIALTKLSEAAEFTCDDWALTRTEQPLELASSISRVAQWMVLGRRAPAVVSIVGRGQAGLAFRVRRILSSTCPGYRQRWLRPLSAVLLFALFYWVPAVPAPATVRASIFIDESIEKSLDSQLGLGPAANFDADALEGEGTVIERRIFVGPRP
jgi:hypothetical protein